MLFADDIKQLLDIVPDFIRNSLSKHPEQEHLIEIVLDIGRRPEARFADGAEYLSYRTIVWQDLDYIIKRLGKFNGDNRAGIEKTLHRISSLRNCQGSVIGLTCRIGRAVFGTVSIIRDLLENKKSILLLGKPGVGKTTAIREIARVLSDGMKKRVIIIDTSNEIAGHGDLPHPSIGKSRRMHVSSPQNQHKVMIEAVENHMPEVIIIDEIGTELEATAARTIAERGIQLIGTVHGNALENLIKNPTVTDLIGGIQYVTLGDEEAKRRGSAKSILERKAPSTFDVAVEIHYPRTWVIHENIENSVDLLLRGQNPILQNRNLRMEQARYVHFETNYNTQECYRIAKNTPRPRGKIIKELEIELPVTNIIRELERNILLEQTKLLIQQTTLSDDYRLKKHTRINLKGSNIISCKPVFLYGVNSHDLKSIIRTLCLPIRIVKEIQYVNNIITSNQTYLIQKRLSLVLHSNILTIYTIQGDSLLQLARAIKQVVKNAVMLQAIKKQTIRTTSRIINKELLSPLEETRLTIEEIVIPNSKTVDLLPRIVKIRKLQQELIKHYQLRSDNIGSELNCCIRIYPN